mmetsp:Transcript_15730/g.26245  ORF Transcript_15730/g.26245 Transcript_15730/m.26245 type:complete len:223 (+) Transcript_15730:51-719(+)
MPYKAKNGDDVPDCCPAIPRGPGRFVHGDCSKCCCLQCCTCTPCSIDCNICAKLCGPCQAGCKPVCGALLKCEEMCQAKCKPLCELGPECPCKAAGCELTLGIGALEKLCGVWHVSTDSYLGFVPSILFPCCCFPCPPGCGQDETVSGDNFAPGGPTEKKVKIVSCLCGPMLNHPCCAPHTACSMGSFGCCMDPLFNGKTPFWFCNENRCISVSFSGKVSPS